jgi:hypothetical protein
LDGLLAKRKMESWEIWGKFEKNWNTWEKLEYLGKIGLLAKNLGKIGIFGKNLGKIGILGKNLDGLLAKKNGIHGKFGIYLQKIWEKLDDLGKMWFLEYICIPYIQIFFQL